MKYAGECTVDMVGKDSVFAKPVAKRIPLGVHGQHLRKKPFRLELPVRVLPTPTPTSTC